METKRTHKHNQNRKKKKKSYTLTEILITREHEQLVQKQKMQKKKN